MASDKNEMLHTLRLIAKKQWHCYFTPSRNFCLVCYLWKKLHREKENEKTKSLLTSLCHLHPHHPITTTHTFVFLSVETSLKGKGPILLPLFLASHHPHRVKCHLCFHFPRQSSCSSSLLLQLQLLYQLYGIQNGNKKEKWKENWVL